LHGDDVEGLLLHFFGCLKISERDEFLGSLPVYDASHIRVVKEKQSIAKLRSTFREQVLKTDEGKLLMAFAQTASLQFRRRPIYIPVRINAVS
jgi:hypothetical protein